MALNTKHSYANRLYAHLTAAISAGATSLSFYPEEITNLLAGWQASTWLYFCIFDVSGNLEIVKMTALSGSTLTVERGQGGTTAQAWGAGSLVSCRAVAEYLTRFLQKGVFRSGAYNPNDTLAGAYTGEKFYQTGPAVEQRRWWINTTGMKWRLLTGATYTGEWQDDDGYWYYTPNWVNYSDPAYWTVTNHGGSLTWDAVNGWWDTGGNWDGLMVPNGTWHVGKTWPDMYIMVLYGGFSLSWEINDADDAQLDVSNWGVPTEPSEEVRPLTWGAFDFAEINVDNRAWHAHFRVYANEGAPYDADWTVTLEPFNNTYWTATMGSWTGSAWQMVWGGSYYRLELTALGSWMTGLVFQRVRITGSFADGSDYIAEFQFKDVASDVVAREGGSDVNPRLGTRILSTDIATLSIFGNYHGINPGGTWLITKIEFLTEAIYT